MGSVLPREAPPSTSDARAEAPTTPARRPILIVLHQEHSTPGRVGRLLRLLGYPLDIRRPRFGDRLPATMAEHTGAVIFGGPMSANDADPWVRDEIDWTAVPLREGAPLLGLCLGAQMIARQLGQAVGPHADGHVEIGYYPITPTAAGDALLGVPFPRWVYHWHREGFCLPPGTVALAEGVDFECQAFRCGANTFGLQFHPEVTYAMMSRWIVMGHAKASGKNARPVHQHRPDWFLHDGPVARWAGAFLEAWASGTLPAATVPITAGPACDLPRASSAVTAM